MTDYNVLFDKAVVAAGLNPEEANVFRRMINIESGWDPEAKSSKGARGLAQLMPDTAKLMGVTDITDPEQNLIGGAKYFKEMSRKFGDLKLAAAAYNAGPQRVIEAGNQVPNIKETQKYIANIFGEKTEAKETRSKEDEELIQRFKDDTIKYLRRPPTVPPMPASGIDALILPNINLSGKEIDQQTAQITDELYKHVPLWKTSDVWRQAFMGGPLRAVQEIAETVNEIGGGLITTFGLADPEEVKTSLELMKQQAKDDLEKLGVTEPESVAGAIVGSITQFLTAFGITKGLIPGGAAHPIAHSIFAGGVAEGVGFDPRQERLSNWIASLNVPALSFIADYIKADKEDSESLARVKAILEGTAFSAISEAVIRVLRAVRHGYQAEKAIEAARLNSVPKDAKLLYGSKETHSMVFSHENPIPRETLEEILNTPINPELYERLSKSNRLAPGLRAEFVFANLKNPDDIVTIMGAYFNDILEASKGGTVKWTEAEKRALELSLEELTGGVRMKPMTNAQMFGYKGVLIHLGEEAMRLKPAAEAGDEVALAKLGEIMNQWVYFSAGLAGAISEAGRILNAAKNMNYFRRGLESFEEPGTSISTTKLIMNKLQHIYYGFLLSRITTQAVNIAGTLVYNLWRFPEHLAEVVWSKMPLIGTGQVSMRSVNAYWSAHLGSLLEAAQVAWNTIKTGKSPTTLKKFEFTLHTIPVAGRMPVGMKWFGHALDMLSDLSDRVMYFMQGSDDFFMIPAQRAQAAYLANLRLDKPIKQEMIDALALKYGHQLTFKDPGGPLLQAMTKAVHEVPPLILVHPFVKAAGNIFNAVVDRSPISILTRRFWSAIMSGSYEREQALAKLSLGLGIFTLAWVWAANGKVTGGGPRDPALRNTWLRVNRPYTIYGYDLTRLEPLGTIFKIAGDLYDIYHLNLGDGRMNRDILSIMGQAIIATSYAMVSKTYMAQLKELIDSIYDEELGGGKRVLRRLITSLIPGAIQQFTPVLDPIVRDTRTSPTRGDTALKQMFLWLQAKLPGYSQQLEPRLDYWGDTIQHWERPWYSMLLPYSIATKAGDAVDRELLRLKMPLRDHPRIIGPAHGSMLGTEEEGEKLIGIELTNKEYNYFKRLFGKEVRLPYDDRLMTVKEALNDLIGSPYYQKLSEYPEATGLTKQNAIMTIINRYRMAAKIRLYHDVPELNERIMERKEMVLEKTTTFGR